MKSRACLSTAAVSRRVDWTREVTIFSYTIILLFSRPRCRRRKNRLKTNIQTARREIQRFFYRERGVAAGGTQYANCRRTHTSERGFPLISHDRARRLCRACITRDESVSPRGVRAYAGRVEKSRRKLFIRARRVYTHARPRSTRVRATRRIFYIRRMRVVIVTIIGIGEVA